MSAEYYGRPLLIVTNGSDNLADYLVVGKVLLKAFLIDKNALRKLTVAKGDIKRSS